MRSRSTAPRTRTPPTINDTIGGIVAAALSTCFVALLLELVFPRATASAAGMLHQHPTPLWVSGLLGTIAVVPAVLLLIISIAGLSLAGALLCGAIGIALVSSAFAGCAIARMVGHSQNRYAMAAVGGIAAGALRQSPRRRFHQRRGLCLYARLHHPNHLAQRPPRCSSRLTRRDSPPALTTKGDRHLCGGTKGRVFAPTNKRGHPIASTGCPDFLGGFSSNFFKPNDHQVGRPARHFATEAVRH